MTADSTVKSDLLTTFFLCITSVLWVIWGLVHVLACVMTISRDTPQAVQGIADAVDPVTLEMLYPDAVGAIVNQHGFNLLWIGAVTTICAPFIWQQRKPAIALAALVGGLTDLGYFLYLDLGGHVHFIPGTVMTLICAAAIICSAIVWRRLPRAAC
ncbi:MAG: hypothetical protein AAF086_00565 [Planctomycetota bacterium]